MFCMESTTSGQARGLLISLLLIMAVIVCFIMSQFNNRTKSLYVTDSVSPPDVEFVQLSEVALPKSNDINNPLKIANATTHLDSSNQKKQT